MLPWVLFNCQQENTELYPNKVVGESSHLYIFFINKMWEESLQIIYASIWILFKIFYLFIFREKGREGEREGEREDEKHKCVVASLAPLTGDMAHSWACALTGN